VLRLVIKIGGHLFGSANGVSADWIEKASGVLRESHSNSDKWVVVVGGGPVARSFIEAARRLGADETLCDEVAIDVTRIHAKLFVQGIGSKAYPLVVRNVEELRKATATHGIVVAGGFWPGQSTFAVSAYCAETIRAERLIVATNVEGVYDKDPRHYSDAKVINYLTYEELRRIIGDGSQLPGEYRLIDVVGLSILERSRIRLQLVDGRDVGNIRRAIFEGYAGTIVE